MRFYKLKAIRGCRRVAQTLIFLTFAMVTSSCGAFQDPNLANSGAVGSAAKNLLTANSFDSLLIEVQPVNGATLTKDAINQLAYMVAIQLNKPKGTVTQVNPSRTIQPKVLYSADDIRDLETATRTKFSDSKKREADIFILVLDAPIEAAPTAMGQPQSATTLVISKKVIESAVAADHSALAPSVASVEQTVVNHLFGHLLGLVNAGSLSQSNHLTVDRHHCSNPKCLMNVDVESSTSVINFLKTNGVVDLDYQCKADLRANGGKGL